MNILQRVPAEKLFAYRAKVSNTSEWHTNILFPHSLEFSQQRVFNVFLNLN